MGKKGSKVKEDEVNPKIAAALKESDECAEGDEAVGDPASAADGEHKDEQQDVELFKKLIKDYLGQEEGDLGEAEAETYHELAKEAFEAYKEMGYSEDEAKSAAGHALKLAKHMASKQSDEAEECGDEKKEEPVKKEESADKPDDGDAEGADADAGAAGDDGGGDGAAESKESAQKIKALEQKLLETQGELAALRLAGRKGEVAKYVDAKLEESKCPRAMTDAFRKSAGEIKSKKDFDEKWALFNEGAKKGRVAVDFAAIFTEKASSTETGTRTASKLDFSDCAE